MLISRGTRLAKVGAWIALTLSIALAIRVIAIDNPEALVIVAPPAALGEMRKALPNQLRGHVISEINKDLTHLKVHELQEAITKRLSA